MLKQPLIDFLNLTTGLVASSIAILAGIYQLLKWVKNNFISKKLIKVYLKEKNIYGVFKDGKEIQLTYQGCDINPVLLKKKAKVIFLRTVINQIMGRDLTSFKLMSIDIFSCEEKTLVDQKPYSDSLNGTFEILQPKALTASSNQSKILFVVEKYSTASQLVQVDIKSGRFEELFSAESFDIIKSGKFKGNFLVSVSEIGDKGRDIFYKICDSNGKTIKRFSGYTEYMTYRSQAMIEK